MAEAETAAAEKAAAETEMKRATAEANDAVQSLVLDAERMLNAGNLTEARSKLDAANKISGATDFTRFRVTQTSVANAQVASLTADATRAIHAGDIVTGKQKVQDALAVPNANSMDDAMKLELQINSAIDPDRVRTSLLQLPDEAFQTLKQSHALPASMLSGFQALDAQAADHAMAAVEAVAELREARRMAAIEAERQQAEGAMLAAKASASREEVERKEKAKVATAEAKKGGRQAIRRGSVAYIEVEGENEVWVSIDEKSHDELNSFSSARNEEAIRQMMQQGRVMVCARRTKVSVVDPGFFSTTIRIMEGKHSGATGIVPNEFLHAELPAPANPEARPGDVPKDKSNSGNSLTVRSSKLVDFVSPATGQKMLMMMVTLKNNGSTPVRVVEADITWSDAAGNVIEMRNYTIYAEFDSAPGIVPGGTWKTQKGEGFIIPYGPGIGEKAKSVKVEITKVLERSDL